VRATATVQAAFSASHLIEQDPVCGREHGHYWSVAVTVEGPIRIKTGSVTDVHDLRAALAAVVAELDHRDLTVMLPGVIATPEGVAVWVRERLLLAFPLIVTVTVGTEDYLATVEWPIR
jgi:6-pyruvoyl tetrahydropterin synthase/QueD family protein